MAEEPPSLLEVGSSGVGVAGGDGLAVDGVVLEVGVLGVPHVANADLEGVRSAVTFSASHTTSILNNSKFWLEMRTENKFRVNSTFNIGF